MREVTIDIWEYVSNPDNNVQALCVTTNGCWSRDKAVMGAGFAKQARDKFPVIQLTLARLLYQNFLFHKEMKTENFTEDEPWNIPYCLLRDPLFIFSFPTKKTLVTVEKNKGNVIFSYRESVSYGSFIVGWKGRADLTLIERSAKILKDVVDFAKIDNIVLPRPGCGRGDLSWKNSVKPVLLDYFDDRFVITDVAK